MQIFILQFAFTAEMLVFYMGFPQRIGDFWAICCGNVGFLCKIYAENGGGEVENCKFLLDG